MLRAARRWTLAWCLLGAAIVALGVGLKAGPSGAEASPGLWPSPDPYPPAVQDAIDAGWITPEQLEMGGGAWFTVPAGGGPPRYVPLRVGAVVQIAYYPFEGAIILWDPRDDAAWKDNGDPQTPNWQTEGAGGSGANTFLGLQPGPCTLKAEPDTGGTAETDNVEVFAGDLDVDGVNDPDPGTSGDPEESPGAFIGLGGDRKRITLEGLPEGVLFAQPDPMGVTWEAELKVTGGTGGVEFWTASTGGDQLTGDELKWGVNAVQQKPLPGELYVEGSSAGEVLVTLSLEFFDTWPDPPAPHLDTVKLTVVGIQSVRWEAIDRPLGDNPNPGGGWRVYPGKSGPDDPVDRSKVRVRARVQPVRENQTVHFRAFDVDDPSASTSPIDDESENQDNRGTPKPGELHATQDETDADGYAEVEFSVTKQPGDNFRVIAHLPGVDVSGVSARQDDGELARLVNATGEEIPSDDATVRSIKASPLLTVWRYLHVEVDQMQRDVHDTNRLTGDIASALYDSTTQWTELKVDNVPVDFHKNDHFNGGYIHIPGLPGEEHIFEVEDFETLEGDDAVFVAGDLTAAAGRDYILWDDDYDQSGDLKVPFPSDADTSAVASEFQRAYVTTFFWTDTPDANITFERNLNYRFEETWAMKTDFEFGGDQVSNDFRAVHLVSCFQYDRDEDFDPGTEGPTRGLADESLHAALIFKETIRDAFPGREDHTVLHELGHLAGPDHEDGGVMDDQAIGLYFFTDLSLAKIRDKQDW